MVLFRFVTKLFVTTLILILSAALIGLGQTVQAQNVCANPNLAEEVEIEVEKNNQNRTADIAVTLNSPPFTNSNVNRFRLYPSNDHSPSTFSDTLQTEKTASYDQSTTDFTVTVEVDIDCSGEQGVLKTTDFSFEGSDDGEGVEVRYDHSIDGDNNITASVLSPTGSQYSYNWYVDKDPDSTDPDFSGSDLSFSPESIGVEGIEADLTLVVSGESDVVGQDTKSLSLADGNNETDSDGDGIIDANDDCPNDPDNECEDEGDDDGGGSDDGGDGDTAGLVNCGNPGADGELQESEMCDYNSFIGLMIILRDWFIGILTIAATLLFVYAGILYLTAAGDKSQVDTAKEIFQNVAGGFVFVLLAFTIIATLVNLLTSEDWRDTWDPAIPIQLSQEIDTSNQLS